MDRGGLGRGGESAGADHPGAAKDVIVTLLVFLLYLFCPKGGGHRSRLRPAAVIKYRRRNRPCVGSTATVLKECTVQWHQVHELLYARTVNPRQTLPLDGTDACASTIQPPCTSTARVPQLHIHRRLTTDHHHLDTAHRAKSLRLHMRLPFATARARTLLITQRPARLTTAHFQREHFVLQPDGSL